MKTYRVQLVEDRTADYDPRQAQEVHADDHEGAAVAAIRQATHWNTETRPQTLWALVSDPTTPTHSTGVPMACHAIRLDFSPTEPVHDWQGIWEHFDRLQKRIMGDQTTQAEFMAEPIADRLEYYQWMQNQFGPNSCFA
jgi:hypothetical protein